jgi:hypothetical protein
MLEIIAIIDNNICRINRNIPRREEYGLGKRLQIGTFPQI